MCDICFQVFTKKSNLSRHKWKCEGTRDFKCSECGDIFYRLDSYQGHVAKVHGGSFDCIFKCDTCSSVFNRKSNMLRHKWKCEGTRVLKCPECQKAFYRIDVLKRHIYVDHGYPDIASYYNDKDIKKEPL